MTAHRGQEWEELEAAALAAASRGWRVFPLQVGGLLPAVRDWKERACTDPERIRRCWAAGAFNVGIVPCPSLLVLDLSPGHLADRLDPPPSLRGVRHGEDVLATLAEQHGETYPVNTHAVRTPVGGTHLYFTHPRGRCPPSTYGPTGQLGWHIGLRTASAYVPAAGTVTSDGPFTVLHDAPPAPLPGWLLALLAEPVTPVAKGAV